MNKSDLTTALSTKDNLPEKTATDIVNLIFNGFTDTLKKGGIVLCYNISSHIRLF